MHHYNEWVNKIAAAGPQDDFEDAIYGFLKAAAQRESYGNVSVKIVNPNALLFTVSDYLHPSRRDISSREKRNLQFAVEFCDQGKYKKFPAFANGTILAAGSPEANAFMAKKRAYKCRTAAKRKAQAAAAAAAEPKPDSTSKVDASAESTDRKKNARPASILGQMVEDSKKQFGNIGKELKKNLKNMFGSFFKK